VPAVLVGVGAAGLDQGRGLAVPALEGLASWILLHAPAPSPPPPPPWPAASVCRWESNTPDGRGSPFGFHPGRSSLLSSASALLGLTKAGALATRACRPCPRRDSGAQGRSWPCSRPGDILSRCSSPFVLSITLQSIAFGLARFCFSKTSSTFYHSLPFPVSRCFRLHANQGN